MLGIDLLAAYTIMHLAAAPGRGEIKCTLPRAPVIDIKPVSNPVQYETRLSSAQLGKMKNNADSPYGVGVDTTTGGLREDKPMLSVRVAWRSTEYTRESMTCIWYDRVELTMTLSPKIYIANDGEFAGDRCRSAILEHERKHVTVDRQVTNVYSQAIGKNIQKIVNQAGAMGPYASADIPKVQDMMTKRINEAVQSMQQPMEVEMRRLQTQVDSLQEYQRISKICHDEVRKNGGKPVAKQIGTAR